MQHSNDSNGMNENVSSTEDANIGASNDQQRIQYLEQSIRFLHMQHQQLVSNLHDEVDQLKRKNRELQFCIVMMQQTAAKADNDRFRYQLDMKNMSSERDDDMQSTKSNDHVTNVVSDTHHSNVKVEMPQEKKLDELKLQFMEEEIKHAKKQFDDARSLIQSLTERLRTTEHQLAIERTKSMSAPQDQLKTHCSQFNDNKTTILTSSTGLPFNATVEPFLVHFPPKPPRSPTLQECQVIVKYLYTVNSQQTHELNQLKTDLRDVLYSHKWTPDAYLLARAYIVDDNESLTMTLPRIPLKHATKKLPDTAYHVKDATSFPPMRPVVGNQAIERLKKTQILHRMKTVKQ